MCESICLLDIEEERCLVSTMAAVGKHNSRCRELDSGLYVFLLWLYSCTDFVVSRVTGLSVIMVACLLCVVFVRRLAIAAVSYTPFTMCPSLVLFPFHY